MATSPYPQSCSSRRQSDAAGLIRVLSEPLPGVPSGDVASVAIELRAMETDRAVAVWRHPGWAGVVGWLLDRAPHCDPTVAATHAVRRAPAATSCCAEAVRLSEFLVRTARNSPADQWPRRMERLGFERTMPSAGAGRTSTTSLSMEAGQLIATAGIRTDPSTWELISASVDIAVDWWAELAARTGSAGEALVRATRSTDRVNRRVRLRSRFDGPAARPLVALLIGGDQWGRWARDAAGATPVPPPPLRSFRSRGRAPRPPGRRVSCRYHHSPTTRRRRRSKSSTTPRSHRVWPRRRTCRRPSRRRYPLRPTRDRGRLSQWPIPPSPGRASSRSACSISTSPTRAGAGWGSGFRRRRHPSCSRAFRRRIIHAAAFHDDGIRGLGPVASRIRDRARRQLEGELTFVLLSDRSGDPGYGRRVARQAWPTPTRGRGVASGQRSGTGQASRSHGIRG